MKSIGSFTRKVYTLLLMFAIFMFILLSIWSADELGLIGHRDNVRSFSEEWFTESGGLISIGDIKIKTPGEKITITKKLPGSISNDDCICIETKNLNVRVTIENKEIYSFKSKENLTGRGYGHTYHTVGLSKNDGGRMVTIEYSGVSPEFTGGGVTDTVLAPAEDYVHMTMRHKFLPFMISALIIFIGIVLIVIDFRISDRSLLPFDTGALGLTAFLVGIWVLFDTNLPQLLFGAVYTARIINRVLILLAPYPLIAFVNSFTRLRRMRYQHIAFGITVASLVFIIAIRYIAGIDMVVSFSRVMLVDIIICVLLIVVIFADNAIYCANNALAVNLRTLYAAGIVFLLGGFTDYLLFTLKLTTGDSFGNFTRVGMLVLLIIMLTQIFKWWTRNQQTVERDRFVNGILQYAVSSDSPDSSISSVLEYMGAELQARRIVIFEDQSNGRFRGTYEWHKEGLDDAGVDLIYLPYDGFVDELVKHFRVNDNRLIVEDAEDYKSVQPQLYNLLKSNNVTNLVGSPLETKDKLIGLLALIDSPKETLNDASEIFGLTSYFLSQLLVQRDEQARLRFYSFNDSLTGALNRRAYKEYIEGGLDKSSAFGYLLCDIDGLEDANNTKGYEAGDRMVIDMVGAMAEVFGIKNVYRLGGAEFAAFGFESEETLFENDVERFKKLAAERGLSVSVGPVYCAFGTMNMNRVLNRASELIGADKQSEQEA